MIGIVCMGVSGPGITDQLRQLLFFQACEMLKEQKDKAKVKSDIAAGNIRTEFKYYLVASGFSGIRFSATVETDRGTTSADFLVDPEAASIGIKPEDILCVSGGAEKAAKAAYN